MTGSVRRGVARAVYSGKLLYEVTFRWQHHKVGLGWARSGRARCGRVRANVAGKVFNEYFTRCKSASINFKEKQNEINLNRNQR